jgi:hypothetical protein
MAFLQLGTMTAHRSVLEVSRLLCMTKKEQTMAMTLSTNLVKDTINNTTHRNNPKMTTTSEDKIKVWGYIMTQYNLMPGLKKFGIQGETAAVKELT